MADDMTPLHCVLCGYAQGGTTLLSQFVRQHPQIDGRFEIGFLLAESPAAFAQLRSKLQEQILRHWDVTAQDLRKICAAETFQQAYQELLDRSDLPDKNVRIYDKMPRYMGRLAEVMLRCTVPAVVIVRDPRALFWSMNKYANRGRPTVERFCKAYVGQGRRCRAAVEQFGSRILVVQHESLCTNPDREGHRVFAHLDLDWDPRYAMLENRLEHVGTDKLRPGLALDTTVEYRVHLAPEVQNEILARTSEFSDWRWTQRGSV